MTASAQTRPDGAAPGGGGGDDEVDPRRWRILWVCLVTGFMTLLDVSIVNVALPSIERGVGASSTQLQWVLTGYAVVFGLALVPAGRLGDSYGRKRIFLVGLVVFLAGSIVCGLARDPWMLVAGRVVQGAGAGTLNPQITAIINSEFRGRERGRAFGMFGGTIGLSTAIGPLLGGLIIDYLPLPGPWRYIFLVNVPVSVVAFALGLRLMPGSASARRERLDVVGSVLLGLAVVLLLLPLSERGDLPLPFVVVSVAVAVVSGVAFVLWERRYEARGHLPLVRGRLLRAPGFAPGVVVGALYFGGFTSIFFSLTLYLQDGLHYSPLQAGLSQTAFAVSAGLASPLASRVVSRLGRTLVVRGLVLVVVGLLGVVAVITWAAPAAGRGWTGLLLVVPLVVMGLGSGQVISPNVNLSLGGVGRADAGSASGVFQTFQRLGSGLGLAVVSSLLFSTAASGGWTRAITVALLTVAGIVVVALVPALGDVLVQRRRAAHRYPEPEGGAEGGSPGDGSGDDDGDDDGSGDEGGGAADQQGGPQGRTGEGGDVHGATRVA